VLFMQRLSSGLSSAGCGSSTEHAHRHEFYRSSLQVFGGLPKMLIERPQRRPTVSRDEATGVVASRSVSVPHDERNLKGTVET
jgi:hypothetical protein